MKAEHYFLEIQKSIKNIASKADLLIFEGPIKKDQWEEMHDDIIILHCFYTGVYRKKPDLLSSFIERDNIKNKLSKKERQQQGAYFTPPYIAEYMVESTIGPLIEKILKDKKIKDKVKKISELTICDPAMGGGIFLVCAHDFIMEKMIQVNDTYTIDQLADMATKTIFGVDVNPKAVEVSKLIMHLNIAKWKMLEKFDEYVNFVENNLT